MSTLEGLLGCSPSDVVYKINSAGVREQEITVSELRERTQNLAFEIVLVYMPFDDCLDPEAYKANVDSMLQKQGKSDWWRLPFNNSLIIVGPHDEYVDPYGREIMYRFRMDGYPFTREGFVQSRMKKLRELTLESLLVYGSRDYVIRGDDRIAVSELQGRNIILYLDHLGEDLRLYDELLNWYDEIKAKHPSFEVVFVRLDSVESSIISSIKMEDESVLSAIMPWLICPFDPDHSAFVAKKIFTVEDTYNMDTLIQFGEESRILSTEAQHLLREQGPGDFPYGDSLRKEVIDKLNNNYEYSDGNMHLMV
ncbi:uncharacterized protein LOC110727692 [Chenopodium quinoa]|uniref:uncharacterized protein LOC110727692 n=1 Tax=Chenopodium quinoa TaxID=63459 RepID=UPI000B78DD3F|nr:uncharacterized protein LOC110727692 [Chenopodium quinoa]